MTPTYPNGRDKEGIRMPKDNDDAGQKTGEEGDAGQKGDGDDGKLKLTQQELDAKMAEVRRGVEKSVSEKFADYDDLKRKAEQYDELEQSKKSDEQKMLERVEAAEKRAESAEKSVEEAKLDALKARVAAKRDLSDAQAARLQGSTMDELEADADEVFGKAKEESSEDDEPDEGPESPIGRPKEKLRPGASSGDDENVDYGKVAEKVLSDDRI